MLAPEQGLSSVTAEYWHVGAGGTYPEQKRDCQEVT